MKRPLLHSAMMHLRGNKCLNHAVASSPIPASQPMSMETAAFAL